MFVLTALAIGVFSLLGLMASYTYYQYTQRRKKERMLEAIDEYRDEIIDEEIETVIMSFNGSDPYSDYYKNLQDDIDQKWQESCELLEKAEYMN